MMIKFILIALFIPFTFYSSAQGGADDCKCCTEAYKQFDFWLGNWDVYDADGNLLGSNTIVSLQDHCVIQENWESPNSTGTSYNYYDSKTLEWNQLWIDNKGGSLELYGTFVNGKMLLKSRVRFNSEGTDEIFDEISWKYNEDGTITQTWVIRSVGGQVVQKVFVGIYKRKG